MTRTRAKAKPRRILSAITIAYYARPVESSTSGVASTSTRIIYITFIARKDTRPNTSSTVMLHATSAVKVSNICSMHVKTIPTHYSCHNNMQHVIMTCSMS